MFPPNNGAGRVRITYGAIPAELTGSSGEALPQHAFDDEENQEGDGEENHGKGKRYV